MDVISLVYDSAPRLDAVVCEDYRITAQTLRLSQQRDPLEIIGAVRWVCHQAEVPFILQTPAVAKEFAHDDRLRHLGLWHSSDHARDATRHLIVYLVAQHLVSLKELV